MNGPGEYDHWATLVRALTGAKGVIVVVVDGNRGSSFSVQGPKHVVELLPSVLRDMAAEIEADQQASPALVQEEGAG